MNKNRLQKIVQKLITESFNNGTLSEKNVKRVVKMLQNLSRAEAIFSLTLYLKGLRRELMKHTLLIESAVPLTKTEISTIKSRFKKQLSVSVVENKVNTSLLGGLKVRIGDMVYDNSLAQKIEQVGKALYG